MGRLVNFRFLVAVVGLLVMPGGQSVRAAQDAGTPTAGCDVSIATPEMSGERVQLVLRVNPGNETEPLATAVNAAWEVVRDSLECYAPEARVVVQRPDLLVVSIGAERDPAAVTARLTGADVLEIIDPRGQMLPVGTLVSTTLGGPEDSLAPTEYAGEDIDDSGYETIVSGADLADSYVTFDQLNRPVVGFELTDDGADRFYEFTSANIGRPMAIVFNKRVISSPTIQDAITDTGTITGPPPDEVNDLVIQLKVAIELAQLEVVSVDGTPVASDGTPVAAGA